LTVLLLIIISLLAWQIDENLKIKGTLLCGFLIVFFGSNFAVVHGDIAISKRKKK